MCFPYTFHCWTCDNGGKETKTTSIDIGILTASVRLLIYPGATELTLISSLAHSQAKFFASWLSAPTNANAKIKFNENYQLNNYKLREYNAYLWQLPRPEFQFLELWLRMLLVLFYSLLSGHLAWNTVVSSSS